MNNTNSTYINLCFASKVSKIEIPTQIAVLQMTPIELCELYSCYWQTMTHWKYPTIFLPSF